jgi:DNA-binding NtrC family response regulator
LLDRVDRRNGRRFSPAAEAWLQGRTYSGNIRELRNLIERASLLADGDLIELAHLTDMPDGGGVSATQPANSTDFTVDRVMPLEMLEARYLHWARQRAGDDLAALARQLGVSLRTLYRKLQRASAGEH